MIKFLLCFALILLRLEEASGSGHPSNLRGSLQLPGPSGSQIRHSSGAGLPRPTGNPIARDFPIGSQTPGTGFLRPAGHPIARGVPVGSQTPRPGLPRPTTHPLLLDVPSGSQTQGAGFPRLTANPILRPGPSGRQTPAPHYNRPPPPYVPRTNSLAARSQRSQTVRNKPTPYDRSAGASHATSLHYVIPQAMNIVNNVQHSFDRLPLQEPLGQVQVPIVSSDQLIVGHNLESTSSHLRPALSRPAVSQHSASNSAVAESTHYVANNKATLNSGSDIFSPWPSQNNNNNNPQISMNNMARVDNINEYQDLIPPNRGYTIPPAGKASKSLSLESPTSSSNTVEGASVYFIKPSPAHSQSTALLTQEPRDHSSRGQPPSHVGDITSYETTTTSISKPNKETKIKKTRTSRKKSSTTVSAGNSSYTNNTLCQNLTNQNQPDSQGSGATNSPFGAYFPQNIRWAYPPITRYSPIQGAPVFPISTMAGSFPAPTGVSVAPGTGYSAPSMTGLNSNALAPHWMPTNYPSGFSNNYQIQISPMAGNHFANYNPAMTVSHSSTGTSFGPTQTEEAVATQQATNQVNQTGPSHPGNNDFSGSAPPSYIGPPQRNFPNTAMYNSNAFGSLLPPSYSPMLPPYSPVPPPYSPPPIYSPVSPPYSAILPLYSPVSPPNTPEVPPNTPVPPPMPSLFHAPTVNPTGTPGQFSPGSMPALPQLTFNPTHFPFPQ